MIVLKDLVVRETKKVDTEEGKVELPGGLYAKFGVTGEEDAIVPIGEDTFNALTQIMFSTNPDPVQENLGA